MPEYIIINMNKYLAFAARTLLLGMLVFELLNLFGILRYKLSFTWLGLMITLIFIWIAVELISFYLKKNLGRPLAGISMLIAAVGVYTDALGDILMYYDKFAWYDQFAHLVGGMAAGAIIFSIIYNLAAGKKIILGKLDIAIFTFCAASTVGVLYELEEYFEDLFTGSRRLGNGFDTANDMFLNLIGIAVSIIIVNLYIKYAYNRSWTNN